MKGGYIKTKMKTREDYDGTPANVVIRTNLTEKEFQKLKFVCELKETNFNKYLRKLVLKDFESFKEQ